MLSARAGGKREACAPRSSLRDCRAFLPPPLAGGEEEGARASKRILPGRRGKGSEAGPEGFGLLLFGRRRSARGEAATGPGRSPVLPRDGEGCGGRRVLGRRSDGRAPGGAGSARCVRRLDGSLVPAIRITYRVSLRSSSSREPRYPSTGVVSGFRFSRPRSTRASIGIREEESPPSLFASPSPDPSPEKERRVRGQGLIGTAPPPSSCEEERGRLPHFASGSHEGSPNRGKRGLHLPSGGSPRRSMVRSNWFVLCQ